ncbi:NAD-binding protein [Nitrosophilus alvini]|uniref:NAD-binding protein n=1 Tax=Nitrosophilus alvini TaxID=2714855 RepID=UPI00190ACEE8|nr:NAD-binding protein [Nitrosophilus alvini]
MDIIIAGAGRVGFRLAKTLSIKHNVTVIDQNEDALNRLMESIDILTVAGNIEDPDTYIKMHDKSADLFIAVTDLDEANIISTLIADDMIKVDKKIIRLKNSFFAKSSIAKKLEITEAVFPYEATAASVEALFDFPKANNVKSFIHTSFKLISVRVQIKPEKILKVSDIANEKTAVAGIERDKSFFIPDLDTQIREGDLVYIFGDENIIKEICSVLDTKLPKKIKRVVIFGAKISGLEIAKKLAVKNIDIKIIESDIELCKKASYTLQENVTVINSKYKEHHLFEEEGLKNADMLIASSDNDEENIIRCIEGKEYGIEKVVAINNDMEYYALMHKLGIVVVRGPKTNAYYSILEKIASSSVISEKHFCGGRGVVFMRKVFPNSKLIGKEIRAIRYRKARFYLLRENRIFSFSKEIVCKEGDIITVFGYTSEEERLKEWIYSL